MGYAYNPVDDTTAITYPGGVAVSRTFDALDRVTGLRDWLGHTTTYGYDPAGNPISETLPNTTSVAWGYDDADRLVGITRTAPLTMPRVYAYTRDGLGQVTGATDSADPTTHGYGYTALNQLRSDTTGITYTASSANDLLAITTTASGAPTTSSLSYNAAHQLTGTQVLAGGVLAHNLTLAYNPDGDRTAVTDTVGGAATSYAYDQADRLVGVTSGGATSSYAYDGTGLRQGKTVNGAASAYTWDVSGGLPALLQENGTRYIYGPDGQPIEQVDGAGNALYYYQDQLGSTRELADGSGRIATTSRYDAYGTPLAKTGSATTPFGYAGQYTDAETGLQYLQARYYDPTTAQFLTRDPLVAETGQPYTYAGANPLNASDPSGLCNVAASATLFGHTFDVRSHVPGTSDDPILCTDAAKLKASAAAFALSGGLANVANSDLSTHVYNNVYNSTVGAAERFAGAVVRSSPYMLVTNPRVYWQQIAQNALIVPVLLNPMQTATQAGVQEGQQIALEVGCGHYGAAAGDLLSQLGLAGAGYVGGEALGAVSGAGLDSVGTIEAVSNVDRDPAGVLGGAYQNGALSVSGYEVESAVVQQELSTLASAEADLAQSLSQDLELREQ